MYSSSVSSSRQSPSRARPAHSSASPPPGNRCARRLFASAAETASRSRRRYLSSSSSAPNPLAVLVQVDGIRRGAEMGRPPQQAVGIRLRDVSDRQNDYHPVGPLGVDDVLTSSKVKRLEIQAVRGVVSRSRRSPVAVDHDGLDTARPVAQTRLGSSSNRSPMPGRCGSVPTLKWLSCGCRSVGSHSSSRWNIDTGGTIRIPPAGYPPVYRPYDAKVFSMLADSASVEPVRTERRRSDKPYSLDFRSTSTGISASLRDSMRFCPSITAFLLQNQRSIRVKRCTSSIE